MLDLAYKQGRNEIQDMDMSYYKRNERPPYKSATMEEIVAGLTGKDIGKYQLGTVDDLVSDLDTAVTRLRHRGQGLDESEWATSPATADLFQAVNQTEQAILDQLPPEDVATMMDDFDDFVGALSDGTFDEAEAIYKNVQSRLVHPGSKRYLSAVWYRDLSRIRTQAGLE